MDLLAIVLIDSYVFGYVMKRVLVIITTDFEITGGLTTVMMNYYRKLDKSILHIDFASTNFIDAKLASELEAWGSKYFCLGDRKGHLFSYISNLRNLLKNNDYDVVHVNGNSSTMIIESLTAKRSGVKSIICHTHTTRSEYPFIHMIFKPLFNKTFTKAIAVSDNAGKWLYNTPFVVLNNAIDTSKYKYDQSARDKLRCYLNIQDRYVIGTVGKLTSSKNQSFLLDVFSEYSKVDNKSVLVIAGGGPLEKALKNKAIELGINNRVIFLGMRSDIEEVIQAFDLFLFTSIYEGFGMVLVEAQASGLQCISSDTVPAETKVSNNINYLSLQDPINTWINSINSYKNDNSDRESRSIAAIQSIENCGFSIDLEARKLEKIYSSEN